MSQEFLLKQPGNVTADQDVLDLDEWMPYQCSVIANRVSACLQGMYGERHGLSVPGWRVMAVLGRYAPLSAKEVGERTAMDQVQVTRAINQMSSVGLISRRVDQLDRRKVALRLSRKGLAAYNEIVPVAHAVEASLLAALTPRERKVLSTIMASLVRRAEELLPDQTSWRAFAQLP